MDHLHFDTILSYSSAELVSIELSLRKSKVVCGLLYRPPSADAAVLEEVEFALEQLSPPKQKSLMLLGDFNIDRSPGASHPILNSIEGKLGLSQVVTTPTRTTSTTAPIIDHVYISDRLTLSRCSDLPPLPGSDHNMLQVSISNGNTPLAKSNRRKIWLYKDADFDAACKTLECLPASIFSTNSVNDIWVEWSDVF